MAWVKLDDQAPRNKKMLRAGPAACWLWVCAIAHSQSQLTDGFVAIEALPMIGVVGSGRVKKLAELLVTVGLFDRVEGGYTVHDYHAFNATAAEVRADREWDRRRKELYTDPALVQAIKDRDQNRCRYCGVGVNWSDRRGPSGGQFDHVEPRGANTLENVVVACRRCNIAKNGRTPEQAGIRLQPAPIQSGTSSYPSGTSSDPVLRARASYPSHPIPSHPVRERAPAPALAGMLPRDHARHVFCGRKCVPEFLHAELLQGLGGDPALASLRLLGEKGQSGWYAQVEAALPEGPVGDDPLKFWRAQFAAAFPSVAPKPKGKHEPASTVPNAQQTAEYLRKQREA